MDSDEGMKGIERDELLKLVEAQGFFVSEGWRRSTVPLDLGGGLRWTPEFHHAHAAMVVLVGPTVPAFLVKRMRAAYASGLQIQALVDYEAINSSSVLRLLSEVDARICLITGEASISSPLSLLKFLGEQEIGVQPDVRRELIQQGLTACKTATSNEMKGKRLEWLLHFMFSQISDFRVKKCNYLTASEELDIVVQVRAIDARRYWAHVGSPFLIGEAKNRAAKADQGVVSKLFGIIHVKRKACKIGVIVSLSGFTSAARTQVLKLSAEDCVFVLIDEPTLQRWATAADYDEELSEIISEAALE